MIFNIINLCGNIFETFIVTLFFSKLSGKRVPKIWFYILCVLLTAFQFVNNNLFLTKSYLVAFGMVLYIFLLSLLYNIKMLQRIFLSIFLFVMFALSEYIVGMSITALMDINIAETQTNMLLFAFCTMTSKFFTLSIVNLLKFNEKKGDNWLPFKLAYKIIPLPLASFFVLALLFDCSYRIEELKFRVLTLIVSLMLIFANILVFYLIDRQSELAQVKESLKFAQAHIQTQINHYSELYSYQNELRSFRHDIKNRFITILGLIQNEETDSAINVLKSSLNFVDDKNRKIIDSGNPVIDAVIQSKLKSAEENKISFDTVIRITTPIKIDELELGVLIGNALDNAIEATQKITGEQDKRIKISIITVDDMLSLSVANPVGNDMDVSSLTTDKKDKINHGYGLKSIRAIVDKYCGELFITCENKIFELKVTVINKS